MDVSKDPGTVALLDQFETEARECEELVPRSRNRRLRMEDSIDALIVRAMRESDRDGQFGPVPVVRLVGGFTGDVVTYRRDGSNPAADDLPLRFCNRCGDRVSMATSKTVPFWVNCGHVVVQADLCVDCAAHAAVNLDAVPQTWV